MTTMGDDVERSCPLCAEEMDLTDQQLKPCRCGYEICVWCWHHIIEMAEKDDSEARCPACRTAYDKEKIVGTAANCERVVAEVSAERKQKPKAKPKTSSDARKHLNSVRVIQRNLVYVIGLPSNMADENLLERREYFGQYGRVLKVSISRTNGGIQQASSVNTFSVYITYAKEEEAIRCIQATHNFVLEGKTLRACFGTTKYCRAWLRNMTCNNPDCLYLHDVGCQEDSFTKDEVITAYTRSRVPAVGLGSGSGSGNAHRHVGSVLPPPADDLPSSIAVSNSKVVLKASHNSLPLAKSSPLDIGGSGKSAGLPAAASWGHRTNLRAPSLSASSAQGIAQEKSETFGTSSVPPTGGGMSAWHDGALPAGMTGTVEENESQRVPVNGRCRPSESFRSTDKDSHAPMTSPARDISHEQCSSAWSDDECAPVNSPEKHSLTRLNGGPGLVEAFKSSGKDSSLAPDSLPETSSSKERSAWYDGAYTSRDIPEEDHAMRPSSSRASDSSKMFNGNHSQTVSVTSADGCLTNENSAWDDDMGSTAVLASDEHHAGSFRSCSAQAFASDPDLPYEFSVSTSHSSAHVAPEEGNIQGLLPGSESNFDRPAQAVSSSISGGSFSNFNGDIQNLSSHLSILNLDKHSHLGLSYSGACDSVPKVLGECRRSSAGLQHSCTENGIGNLHSRKSFDAELQLRALHIGAHSSRAPCSSGPSLLSEEVSQKSSQSGGDDLLSNSHEEAGSYEEYAKYSGRLHNPPLGKNATLDGGEGNIISNILSMDFDPWSDTSVSTDSFAKFLGEADEHIGRLKMPNLWKGQSNSESRFSFARQESQASFRPSLNEFSLVPTNGSGLHGSTLMDIQNGFASASTRQPMTYIGNQLGILTEKSGGSRTKTSAPPGFSFPSRFQAPPPGFSSQDKLDQAYDGSYSDNHLLGGPSLMKDYQMSPAGYNGDVEFIDPAILAVGKGIDNSGFDSRFTSPSQFNAPDISSRLQLLMQQSVSHQEQRIPDNYSYMSSRHLHQNLPSPSPYGLMATTLQQTRNPQWESWSDVHGNTEILRNKALGLNRFFSGNEETFRAGLNRDFGI